MAEPRPTDPRPTQTRLFTVEAARGLLGEILPQVEELIEVRAELAERAHTYQESGEGGIPEIKALEARMGEILDHVKARGVEVKGYAPVLLDFPAQIDGNDVLLCWLEGEDQLAWYHRVEHGFMGRRRIPDEAA